MKRLATAICICIVLILDVNAQEAAPSRRPISNVSPTWLIHIDVWVQADPMKVIDLIPEDIRPYVIFNLSLSVSDLGTGPYGKNTTTPTILESWLRACAERGVWATVQPASGYDCNLPYTHSENDIYERYYQDYPNFLGYNFAEQCWGFGNESNIDQRMKLLADLIQLGAKYGGYLFVSHTQTITSPNVNALAFLKRNPDFNYWAKRYKDNYITLEKQTTSRGFYDIESTSLGAYLSGYCGNYGTRFDDCGWSYLDCRAQHPFPEALGGMMIAEHFLLTGVTVQDGPELTWVNAVVKDGTEISTDGYSSKKFKTADNFINHNVDLFRKQLDGTFRIPSKEEVIARTKVAYVNDVGAGSNLNRYASEPSLFTGLYAVDGEHSENRMWTKSSGRYPTIPSIFREGSYETGGFQKVVKKSGYSTLWPSIAAKKADLDALFPEEYTGNIFAGRIYNTWMTYNPYMGRYIDANNYEVKNSPTSGSIPFQYNTCEKMELSHSNYGYAVIKEFADHLDVYANNFCSQQSSPDVPLMRNTQIKIYGSTQKPTYTYDFRVKNPSSSPTTGIESTTLLDFESTNINDTYPMTGNGQSQVVADPTGVSGKALHVFGPANQSFPTFTIRLSAGKTLGDYQTLKMDFNGTNETGRYGQGMRMSVNNKPLVNFDSPATFGCPNGSWGRGLIALPIAKLNLSEEEKSLTEFTLTIGSATGSGDYYIDNIVLEREVEITPVTDSWDNGVFTLTINHNSPIDISIYCSGNATNRSTDYPAAPTIVEPEAPKVYTGARQHEFEDFEYKNIANSSAGSKTNELTDYTGMSYSSFGRNTAAAMRKEIHVPAAGKYKLKVRYQAPSGDAGTINLLVNNQETEVLSFSNTPSWKVVETNIDLHAGSNRIEFKANAVTNTLYLDNIIVEADGTTAIPKVVGDENITVVSQEYYDMMGRRIYPASGRSPKDLHIVKSILSDGSIRSRKALGSEF